MSKKEARAAAKALLKQLKGRGWKIRLHVETGWQAPEWCFEVVNGPLVLTVTSDGHYIAAIDAVRWWESARSPNAAIRKLITELEAPIKKTQRTLAPIKRRLGL